MKNLISLLLLVFFTTVTFQSFAQTFGLKAGVNIANMLFKDDYNTYSDYFSPTPGLLGGIMVDFPVKDWLSVESGLQVAQKGYRYEFDGSGQKGRVSLFYAEIPVLIKPSYDFDNFKVYGIIGPYFGLGTLGRGVEQRTYQGKKIKDYEAVKWGDGTNEEQYDLIFKRGEIGLTIGAGIMIKQTQIGISYNTGSNISIIHNYGTVQKNRVVSLTIQYMFED